MCLHNAPLTNKGFGPCVIARWARLDKVLKVV